MDEDLVQVKKELEAYFHHLKAEVFVAEILEQSSLQFSDINVYNASSFSRSYRRDLVSVIVDKLKEENKLKLTLSRNGLYDFLPQAMFHDKQKNTVDSFKELRYTNKKEERNSRMFFTPIENEFFLQKVKVEQNERELINKFESIENEFMIDLWGLDKTLPLDYNVKMLKILPFAHQISGNISSIESCLSNILSQKVSIIHRFDVIKNKENKKNDIRLDVDFTLAIENSKVHYPIYEINIGPMTSSEANKFLPNSNTMKFISNFCEYFVPIDVEVEVKIKQHNTENNFELSETNPMYLGLTTVL